MITMTIIRILGTTVYSCSAKNQYFFLIKCYIFNFLEISSATYLDVVF